MTTFIAFPKRINGGGVFRVPGGPQILCAPGFVLVGGKCVPATPLTPDPFIPPIEDPTEGPVERERIPEEERQGFRIVRDAIINGRFGPKEEAPVPIQKKPLPIILIGVAVVAIFLVRR